MTKLLITGGAGFIGSHTCVVLLEAGHDLVVLDDFSNSSIRALDRVAELAGITPSESSSKQLLTVTGSINDSLGLAKVFSEAREAGQPIEGVIHFAGLKAVGESVSDPLRYWDVNVGGSLTLINVMAAFSCHTLVFSSSATLYGYPDQVPVHETAPIQPINPYGHSKAAVEHLLNDLAASAPEQWRIACLRYFNPVGAHPSGRIGEDPLGIPNNLFPFVSQVAVGRRERVQIFGGDWTTPDGTCIRDYIHVMDLAEGHKAALDCLLAEPAQLLTLNLGSGQGASVLEVVHAFERASCRQVPYEVVARRAGDAAITVADPSLALQRLGWQTQRGLDDICRDGWTWQSANPAGYSDKA
jgi:UDP-glucose 4-epimerase